MSEYIHFMNTALVEVTDSGYMVKLHRNDGAVIEVTGDSVEDVVSNALYRIESEGGGYTYEGVNIDGSPYRYASARGGVIVYWTGKKTGRLFGCYLVDITGGEYTMVAGTPSTNGYANYNTLARALENKVLEYLRALEDLRDMYDSVEG